MSFPFTIVLQDPSFTWAVLWICMGINHNSPGPIFTSDWPRDGYRAACPMIPGAKVSMLQNKVIGLKIKASWGRLGSLYPWETEGSAGLSASKYLNKCRVYFVWFALGIFWLKHYIIYTCWQEIVTLQSRGSSFLSSKRKKNINLNWLIWRIEKKAFNSFISTHFYYK